jgi:hypothetical protein
MIENKLSLTRTEIVEIQTLTKLFSERAGYRITLDSLLSRWSYFIGQCEKGYEDCLDEYTNDLGTRELLQEVIEKVTPHLAAKLKAHLVEKDRRFIEATEEISTPLLTLHKPLGHIKRMLYFRVPKKLGEDMEKELRSMGVLRRKDKTKDKDKGVRH